MLTHISIHALHEESDMPDLPFKGYGKLISIHALHEESDHGVELLQRDVVISIHALHEESDSGKISQFALFTFQSTLSMRRATRRLLALNFEFQFQSTLSMRRATVSDSTAKSTANLFQSTLSMRRATWS